MSPSNPNIVAVLWRVVIAALVIAGRVALDRVSPRGSVRRQPRRGRWAPP